MTTVWWWLCDGLVDDGDSVDDGGGNGRRRTFPHFSAYPGSVGLLGFCVGVRVHSKRWFVCPMTPPFCIALHERGPQPQMAGAPDQGALAEWGSVSRSPEDRNYNILLIIIYV